MNSAENIFHEWLAQLGKNASLQEQIETINSKIESYNENTDNDEDLQSLQTAKAKLDKEYSELKTSAQNNKKNLLDLVNQSPDKELIIHPQESQEGGLTPHAYRIYLDKGELKYLTLK